MTYQQASTSSKAVAAHPPTIGQVQLEEMMTVHNDHRGFHDMFMLCHMKEGQIL